VGFSNKAMLDIAVFLLFFEIFGIILLQRLFNVDMKNMWPGICMSIVLMLLGIATAGWMYATEHVIAFLPS
jgi:hypothetical protein